MQMNKVYRNKMYFEGCWVLKKTRRFKRLFEYHISLPPIRLYFIYIYIYIFFFNLFVSLKKKKINCTLFRTQIAATAFSQSTRDTTALLKCFEKFALTRYTTVDALTDSFFAFETFALEILGLIKIK